MIDEADIHDIPELLEMSEAFWKAGGPIEDWDKDYTEAKLKSIIENHKIFVSRGMHGLEGMIIILYVDHLCAPVINACELAWYVKPDSRGSSAGMNLLKAAIKDAREVGAKTMTLAFMERSMPDMIKSIYERLGFELNETSYLMRL